MQIKEAAHIRSFFYIPLMEPTLTDIITKRYNLLGIIYANTLNKSKNHLLYDYRNFWV